MATNADLVSVSRDLLWWISDQGSDTASRGADTVHFR
jgi:hypothetical protein